MYLSLYCNGGGKFLEHHFQYPLPTFFHFPQIIEDGGRKSGQKTASCQLANGKPTIKLFKKITKVSKVSRELPHDAYCSNYCKILRFELSSASSKMIPYLHFISHRYPCLQTHSEIMLSYKSTLVYNLNTVCLVVSSVTTISLLCFLLFPNGTQESIC